MPPEQRTTRTFLIVGASTGLGRATARALARHHRVIVAGRDVERTRAAVPEAAEVARVDLADLADVMRFCDEVGCVDGIVCNAGVQALGAPTFTRDGFEQTFAVNHLAHFAIATRVPASRVVFVGSGTHDPRALGGRLFGFRGGRYREMRALAAGTGDPDVSAAQRGRDRYATSKLCNLLTVAALARRGVDAYALDPGLMPGTGLAREQNAVMRFGWHTVMRALALIMPGASSARRSGAALAWLVADYTGSDRYLDYRRRAIEPSPDARRADLADELYDASLALIAEATRGYCANRAVSATSS